MGGDYTRLTFDPRKNHAGVLMQQGRVQLDADWNEQAEIVERRLRIETADVVGRSGVPADSPDAFKIAWDTGGLTIGAGRMYVDGLLVENHGPDGGAVAYDAATGEIVGTDPVPYTAQPYFPNAATIEPLPTDAGPHLVYLDVWQREVTALQEPALIEPAVGFDTATRLQTVWRVRVLSDVGTDVTCSTTDSGVAGWSDRTRPSGGRLSTEAVAVPSSNDPCTISADGGYRGIENRLYRVEIHDPGAPGAATFKWSRDNASVATGVTNVDSSARLLTVQRAGRDGLLRFVENDWVEVVDDSRELRGDAGEIRQIAQVDGVSGTILLHDPLTVPFDANAHTRMRRWDEKDAPGVVTVPAAGIPYVLEDGVQVTFDTDGIGEFKTGDYWVFAARTPDSSVELLDHAPPRGPRHHFARLATVTLTDPPTDPEDCRPAFLGLADLRECGTCTISVRPHDDLAARIAQLPVTGGRVCFAAGEYRLRAPLTLTGRTGLELVGTGPGTILRALASKAAIVLQGCTDIEISHMRFEGAAATGEHRDGALTVVDCTGVRVADCSFSCPDSGTDRRGTQSGLTARATTGAPAGDIVVERNRFDVGAWQTGVLLVDLAFARVRENRIAMPDADKEPTAPPLQILVHQFGALLAAVVQPAGAANTVPVALGGAVLHVDQASPLLAAFHAVADSPEAAAVKTPSEAVALVRDTVAAQLSGPGMLAAPVPASRPSVAPPQLSPASVELPPGVLGTIVNVLTPAPLRAIGQGIVIAGTALGTVDVLDNVVEDAVEGIKVTASQKRHAGPSIDSVLLSRNIVQSLVPAQYGGARRAVVVAHSRSTHVHATRATVRRTGYAPSGRTPIDAVDVEGAFGEFLDVRETSTDGFTVGARVTQPRIVPTVRMWLVAETMARSGNLGAHVPPTVEHERNYPLFAARSVALLPRAGSVQQATAYAVTATAIDQQGDPVPGMPIHFSVEGTNVQPDRVVTTDVRGRAVYSYTPAKAGEDAIRAFADNDLDGVASGDDPINSAGVVVTQQAHLTLTANSQTPAPGTTLTITAQVLDATGARLANVTVRFSVSGGNVTSGTAVTNSDGAATFAYRGMTAKAADTVAAFADMSNNGQADATDPSAELEVTWDDLHAAAVTLLPPTSSTPVGQQASFAAVVTNPGGLRVPGVTVSFAVSGANTVAATPETTDATGVASFSYAGNVAGQDAVQASVPGVTVTVPHLCMRIVVPPGVTTVPNVGGMTQAAAAAALKVAGLVVGKVTVTPGIAMPIGGTTTVLVVVDQNPDAGVLVARGTAVDLRLEREVIDQFKTINRLIP